MALDQAQKETVKLADTFRPMLATDGWRTLEAIFTRTVNEGAAAIVTKPCGGSDDTYRQEHEKGRIVGLRALLDFPRAIVRDADEILRAASPEDDEGDE